MPRKTNAPQQRHSTEGLYSAAQRIEALQQRGSSRKNA